MNFLTHLAVCHTVVIQTQRKEKLKDKLNKEEQGADSDRSHEQVREVFSAQSPDELALVNAAKAFGMRFRSRPSQRAIIVEQDLPVNAVSGGPSSIAH